MIKLLCKVWVEIVTVDDSYPEETISREQIEIQIKDSLESDDYGVKVTHIEISEID